MLVSQIQNVAGQSGKKMISQFLDYLNKLCQYHYQNVKQQLYQINQKPVYATSE